MKINETEYVLAIEDGTSFNFHTIAEVMEAYNNNLDNKPIIYVVVRLV